MKQSERIVKYIERFGSITPLEAFRDLGITKLATRVSEMKKDGYTFYQKMEKGVNRWGEPTKYMRYAFKQAYLEPKHKFSINIFKKKNI